MGHEKDSSDGSKKLDILVFIEEERAEQEGKEPSGLRTQQEDTLSKTEHSF